MSNLNARIQQLLGPRSTAAWLITESASAAFSLAEYSSRDRYGEILPKVVYLEQG